MHPIRLNKVIGVPVFRQIVEQIIYMIEMGQLKDGDRLPSSRTLADNLHINRNTVVRAYAELRDRGLVTRRGPHGMVVREAKKARDGMSARESAHAVLGPAVGQCLELGLSAEEIASLAYQHGLHAERTEVRLAFVECNLERAEAFAMELSAAVETPIVPLVLGDVEPADLRELDLVITTFFHLADVRRLVRGLPGAQAPEVLGIVVAPHLKTLVRLREVPSGHRVGVYYTTDQQAEGIRLWVGEAGIEDVHVITGPDDPAIEDCDLVVVPSEAPELAEDLRGRVPLVEFGNVLDAGSIKMVSEVVSELRELKATAMGQRPPLPAAAV